MDSAKISDSKIADNMDISPQAVFKIRSKLEEQGVIKGYAPVVDFKKIGVNILAMLVIQVQSKVWQNLSEDLVSERISQFPHVISAFRVADAMATHIILFGFKDTFQKEQYISQIQTKFTDEIKIKEMYVFSVDKIITQHPKGLLNLANSNPEFLMQDMFHLGKKSEQVK